MSLKIHIKHYEACNATDLAKIFIEAIQQIGKNHYTQTMLDAWCEAADNSTYWQKRLGQTQPFIAMIGSNPVGFIELEFNGHIGFLYVSPNYARQGIATFLYQYLEKQAIENSMTQLFVEASYASKPLFERQGFKTISQNNANKGLAGFTNFTMVKTL